MVHPPMAVIFDDGSAHRPIFKVMLLVCETEKHEAISLGLVRGRLGLMKA